MAKRILGSNDESRRRLAVHCHDDAGSLILVVHPSRSEVMSRRWPYGWQGFCSGPPAGDGAPFGDVEPVHVDGCQCSPDVIIVMHRSPEPCISAQRSAPAPQWVSIFTLRTPVRVEMEGSNSNSNGSAELSLERVDTAQLHKIVCNIFGDGVSIMSPWVQRANPLYFPS